MTTLHTKDAMAIYRYLVYTGFAHKGTVHLVCDHLHAPSTLSLLELTDKGVRRAGNFDAAMHTSLMAVEPGHTWNWIGRWTTARVTRLSDADVREAVGEDAHPILVHLN